MSSTTTKKTTTKKATVAAPVPTPAPTPAHAPAQAPAFSSPPAKENLRSQKTLSYNWFACGLLPTEQPSESDEPAA